MRVWFEMVADAPVCRVVARRRTGPPFPVSAMGGAFRLPHDLGTFVVERELGLRGGFCRVPLTSAGRPGGRRALGKCAGYMGVISCQPRGSIVQVRRSTGPRISPSAL